MEFSRLYIIFNTTDPADSYLVFSYYQVIVNSMAGNILYVKNIYTNALFCSDLTDVAIITFVMEEVMEAVIS